MATRPGTLISTEPLPHHLWPAGTREGLRVRYQGIGYDGDGRVVTGSVFLPEGEPPATGWPVLSWAHCTVGLTDADAPSEAGLHPAERKHLEAWLRAGYLVAATDYEGLGGEHAHPYLNGAAEADDVVDIVRAAHQLGHRLDQRWVVAGFSQGGHATLFTGLVATSYAPELDFRGSIALAPPVRLARFVRECTADPRARLEPLVPLFLAGLAVSQPGFRPQDYLNDQGDRLVELAVTASMGETVQAARRFTNEDIGATGLGTHPDVQELLRTIDVPATLLDRPVLIGVGDADIVLPMDVIDGFVELLRANGNTLRYETYAGVEHIDVPVAAAKDAVEFADELIAPLLPPTPPRRESQVADPRFRALDVTGDGRLQGDDFEALALRVAQRFGAAPHSAKALAVREGYRRLWLAMAERCDADQDSQIGVEEFAAALDRMDAAGAAGFDAVAGPLAQAVLALADADASGALDQAEFTRLLGGCGVARDEAERVFRRFDGDGCGAVNASEIVAAVRDFLTGRSLEAPGSWLFGRG